MIDYRLKENRREGFIEYFGQMVTINDCDSALFMTNYLFNRFEYNSEQRYWTCWLYGNTYNIASAWIAQNEFPDFKLVGYDRLKKWNDENYKRLRYQTDTKWNKGHLPEMYKSYRALIGEKSQEEFFRDLMVGDPAKDFEKVFATVKEGLFKFGRYSTWFYLQTLKQCAGLNIEPANLLLSDNGSESHRKGFFYSIGREDLIDEKITAKQYEEFEVMAAEILQETKKRYPDVADKLDYFAYETCLCSYKKLFRRKEGRYLGYYLDRQFEEIKKVQADGWDGINWKPLWQAREETVDSKWLTQDGISKDKMNYFLDRGNFSVNDEKNSLDSLFL